MGYEAFTIRCCLPSHCSALLVLFASLLLPCDLAIVTTCLSLPKNHSQPPRTTSMLSACHSSIVAVHPFPVVRAWK